MDICKKGCNAFQTFFTVSDSAAAVCATELLAFDLILDIMFV